MKVKLVESALSGARSSDATVINKLFQLVKGLSKKTQINSRHFENQNPIIDGADNEMTLYVDVAEEVTEDFAENSNELNIILYVGGGSGFSDNSMPFIIFSLDSLIEEKIELLDATLVSEKNIAVLQRLAIRLTNHANQLKEALKRHQISKNRTIDKNSPFW